MNLVKKFPGDTLLEIASKVVDHDDNQRSKEPPMYFGTRAIEDIKKGWFAKNASDEHNKITNIVTSQGAVKKVTLSSGNYFLIDSTSTIEVGESLDEYAGLITSTVTNVEEVGNMNLYELTVEGDGVLLINNVTIA